MAALLLVLPVGPAWARPDAGREEILLVAGAKYRARLKLGFLECFASRERIGSKLGRGGFGGVRVFMSARELPPDWPAPFRARAGACERYAEGTWSRASTPRQRPSSIESWWVARPAPEP